MGEFLVGTSGTITFNETRDTLITNALQLLGVVASGETANANDITFCASILNQMVKAWQAQGIHLWTEEEGTLFLTNATTSYNLAAGGSGVKASDGTGTPVETSLSVAALANATTITCKTVTGMSNSDNIGIQLDNNTLFWTTISSINTSTLVVTLTAGITSAASSGNQVYTYTTQMARPLSIQDARLRDKNGFDRPILIKPRHDYFIIPQKTLAGTPTVLYYSPQLSVGTVYLWPTPNDVSQRIEFTYLRTIQDFDNSSDNPDLPQEWIEAIVYNLAVRIAPAYGFNLTTQGITGNPDLVRMASQFLEDMKAWDAEQPFVSIVPNYRYTHK